MKKYEYKLFEHVALETEKFNPIDDFLKPLGLEGWDVRLYSDQWERSGKTIVGGGEIRQLRCRALAVREIVTE